VLRVASSSMSTLALGARLTRADAVKTLLKDKRRRKGSKGERSERRPLPLCTIAHASRPRHRGRLAQTGKRKRAISARALRYWAPRAVPR
jgi:hypothetical protein